MSRRCRRDAQPRHPKSPVRARSDPGPSRPGAAPTRPPVPGVARGELSLAPAPGGAAGPGRVERAGAGSAALSAERRARAAGMALDFLAGCVGGECRGLQGEERPLKNGGEAGERRKEGGEKKRII